MQDVTSVSTGVCRIYLPLLSSSVEGYFPLDAICLRRNCRKLQPSSPSFFRVACTAVANPSTAGEMLIRWRTRDEEQDVGWDGGYRSRALGRQAGGGVAQRQPMHRLVNTDDAYLEDGVAADVPKGEADVGRAKAKAMRVCTER